MDETRGTWRQLFFAAFESIEAVEGWDSTDNRRRREKNRPTRRKIRRATQEQIATIQRCEGSCRAVARQIGLGKSTVSRYRQAVYDAWEAADDAASNSDSYDEAPTIEFERLENPRRCAVHGLTHVWPCVQCAAKLAEFE